MRRRHLLSLVVCTSFSTLAAADIGQPTSFSVTVSRSSGTVSAVLEVTTQGAVNRASSDEVVLAFAIIPVGASPTSDSAAVVRGLPTSNGRFAASFSLSVPNEHAGFKYLAKALAGPVVYDGYIPSSSYAEVFSFTASLQPSIDLLIPATPPPGGPWLWAKGRQEAARSIPALSLAGIVGLGVVLALAGAFLMRRS